MALKTAADVKSWLVDNGFEKQEYPTEPLDKVPARQGEFELAGKKNIG